jgi:hypothetical protein
MSDLQDMLLDLLSLALAGKAFKPKSLGSPALISLTGLEAGEAQVRFTQSAI